MIRPDARRNANPLGCSLLAGLLLVAGGCGEEVYSDYGHRGGYTQTSLNGTRVLGDMLIAAGHQVRSRSYISPSLENADVIVWFPDDFDAPSLEVEAWLTTWLSTGDRNAPPRVLVYVGRDYDAAPDYWQRMQKQPPPGLTQEYARRLAEAQRDAAANQPAKLARPETDDWFRLDTTKPPAKVKNLSGPWAEGIDASKVEIERNARLIPIETDYTPLLVDESNLPLASEYVYVDYYESEPAGRLIMIENGSWLLNARLVNHEHRRLAGKLVNAVGPPSRTVVFLESGAGGPTIHETEPSAQPPTGLQMFRLWPIGVVLTQLAALGIVYALMKWPVFGTPARLPHASLTDFGSHIAALGRLLGYSGNRAYAIQLLRLYRQSLRRDSVPLSEGGQQHPLPAASVPSPPASE